MRSIVRVAATLLLLGGVGCQSREPVGSNAPLTNSVPTSVPQYRGPVLEVDPVGPRYLIQYQPVGASTGRVWIGVRADTKVQAPGGGAVASASVRRGMVLSVWTTQPLLESDPAQTTGDTIVVERGR